MFDLSNHQQGIVMVYFLLKQNLKNGMNCDTKENKFYLMQTQKVNIVITLFVSRPN